MSRQTTTLPFLYLLFSLLFGLALTATAYADPDDDDGYGPGYMMMWTDPEGELKLSDEQRQKVYKIQHDMRKKQWQLMEQIHNTMSKVFPLMNSDKRDTKAILSAFDPMFKMHKQMLMLQIETANQIDAVLTPEQRKTFDHWRGRGYGPGRGNMGPGMMGRGMMGGYGPGMMGGYGPGMMGGYGPGMMGGYGPGMMGGYGPGMMGGYGPGMMGGFGGMGMMGGFGGMGMMGIGPVTMLDLSDKKREKIYDIQRDMRKEQWEVMQSMFKHMEKVNSLMSSDKRDTKAILAAYEPIYDLQRKMLKNHIETANRIDAVLTPAERKQLREWRKDAPQQMMWGQ